MSRRHAAAAAVAVVLTLLFAAGLIRPGGGVYRAGLTATGTRMHRRAALVRAWRAGRTD